MPQVATLQLELEFIYGSLEDEVLDIAPESLSKTPNGLLARSGTSDEVLLGPLTLLLMLALLCSLALHLLAPTFSRTTDHASTAGLLRPWTLLRNLGVAQDLRLCSD